VVSPPPATGTAGKRFNGLATVAPDSGEWQKFIEASDRVRVSPDGRTVAFRKDRAVWTCASRGDLKPQKVADLDGVILVAGWSPDGKQILVSAARGEGAKQPLESWRVNADGSGRDRLPVPETDFVFDWSPDGAWLLIPWRTADEWLFVRPGPIKRIVAVDQVTRLFTPDAEFPSQFPRLGGWCCSS
jgi:hypothetical protein